jgi:hypothetical protein
LGLFWELFSRLYAEQDQKNWIGKFPTSGRGWREAQAALQSRKYSGVTMGTPFARQFTTLTKIKPLLCILDISKSQGELEQLMKQNEGKHPVL